VPEVSVSVSVPLEGFGSESPIQLVIQGRIDGVFQEENRTVLEEIKTTTEMLDTIDPDEQGVHLGQLKIYGYVYAQQNDLRDRQKKIRLDLSLFADCIIGDYNYLFDPRVSLKRFFGSGWVGCGRPTEPGRRSGVRRSSESHRQKRGASCLTSLNRTFLDLGKALIEMERASLAKKEAPEALYEPLRSVREAMEEVLQMEQAEPLPEQFLELLYRIRAFLAVYELFDDTYVTVIHKRRSNVEVKLLCCDPSGPIRRTIEASRATVFFSATLSPLEYYQRMLGWQEQDGIMQLSSPFPKENLLVCLADQISTRFRHRDTSYRQIGLYISKLISPRRGNYLVYFPSYAYLERVYERFIELSPETSVLKQEPGMDERQREEFLRLFRKDPTETLVGFAVVGGIFGEGIDLVGERLTGAVVVGVASPQISFEQDLLKQFFEQALGGKQGFHFAYTFPGFNRIHQAVGRVIRSESDRGIVLLIGQHDVIVVDLFEKIFQGTFSGGNLSTAIATRTGRGQVIYGGIRDVQQIQGIENLQTFYKGNDPTGIRDVTLTGMNVPCRIGGAVCMPGDVVLGTVSGVLFIPAHLAEECAVHSEKTRLRERVYTSAQMDTKWSQEIEADFAEWRETNTPEELQHLRWEVEADTDEG